MLDSETSIIKMIQNGARGYILKDAETDELRLAFKEVTENGYYYNDIVSRKMLHSINEQNAKNEHVDFRGITEREQQFCNMHAVKKHTKKLPQKCF